MNPSGEATMAKRTDVSIKADEYAVDRARIAAAYLKMNLAEYVSMVVLERADRDIKAASAKEVEPKPSPKKRSPK